MFNFWPQVISLYRLIIWNNIIILIIKCKTCSGLGCWFFQPSSHQLLVHKITMSVSSKKICKAIPTANPKQQCTALKLIRRIVYTYSCTLKYRCACQPDTRQVTFLLLPYCKIVVSFILLTFQLWSINPLLLFEGFTVDTLKEDPAKMSLTPCPHHRQRPM